MSFLWSEYSHMYGFLSSTNGRLVSKNKNKNLTKKKNQDTKHVPTDQTETAVSKLMSNRAYRLHLMDLGWTELLSDHTVVTPHPSDSSNFIAINYVISQQLPLYCHLSAFSVSITSPGLCFSAIRILINETYADRIIKRGRKIFHA